MKSCLDQIEDRFKAATGISGDLSKFPLRKADNLQFATDRGKSREYAEVFTPLYIVDEMLQTVPSLNRAKVLDLCAGHGQFTVRILHKLAQNKRFDIRKHLRESHFFAELQTESCLKLLWIFGQGTFSRPPRINLAIGDALQLGRLPKGWRGIWLWLEALEAWMPVTGVVHALIPDGWPPDDLAYSLDDEARFVKVFEAFVSRLNQVCKEPKMTLKQIAATKEGRKFLSGVVREIAGGVEQNWQNVETPDDIVRDMVKCVPDLKDLNKILVLFNIEYVEYLVKDMDIDPARIDFGADSLIRSEQARSIYGAHAFSIGRNFEEMRAVLDGRGGQYDVVFSNPPYQTMDGGNNASAKPLYHKIVEYAVDVLKPNYVCMITPSRWMAGGKGLDQYRERMLKDKHLRLIEHFSGAQEIFPNVNIAGGVNYFLWDSSYSGVCVFNGEKRDLSEYDIVVADNKSIGILKKVLSIHKSGYMDGVVSASKPYGFRADTTPSTKGVPCWFKQSQGLLFVSPAIVKDTRNDLEKWKILAPRTIPGADVIKLGMAPIEGLHATNLIVAKPGECCSETYLVLDAFKTEKEAKNFLTYVKTKFFRFMLLLRVVSQDIPSDRYSWVPDLCDYSKAWSDEELYKHFGLTRKETEHVEQSVKTPLG